MNTILQKRIEEAAKFIVVKKRFINWDKIV